MHQAAHDPEAMASEVSTALRAKFIERTYLHLALAISVFVVLSAVAQNVPGVELLVGKMLGHRYSWGVVLALFCGAGYIADKWASGSSSTGMQYMGLLLYTVAEVVIFIPLIFLVKSYVGVEPILSAGAATLAVFAGLTAYVFITKKDFSFIKGTLTTISMAAVGLVIASLVWGFHLGMVFSAAMIVLGAGYILYYTSNIQRHYRPDQHVAAALALFSALAFVFWYVLRILLSLVRD
ncbi:MAG: US12 family protein [Nannocystaceae bacterium]|nr:US12 family protein [Nannocystaceae bacterium]